MDLDRSITQGQWKTFLRQTALVFPSRRTATAEPLPRGTLELGLAQGFTPIDQRDPAWINTFVHPDLDCPLGDSLELPELVAGYGASDAVTAGMLFTYAPNANYGILGADATYRFTGEAGLLPAVSGRVEYIRLLGVRDFDVDIANVGVSASKRIGIFRPFIGIRGLFVSGREQTDKVDLKAENNFLAQGMGGLLIGPYKGLRVLFEYDVAAVSTFAVSLSYGFGLIGL